MIETLQKALEGEDYRSIKAVLTTGVHCEKWQRISRLEQRTYRRTSGAPSPPGRSAIGNLSSQSARSRSTSRILA